MLVNKVIDEIPGVLVLQGLLVDPSFVEKLLKIWVNILQVKAMVGIPPHMADVLEIGWHSNVLFFELSLYSLFPPLPCLIPPVCLDCLQGRHPYIFHSTISNSVPNPMFGGTIRVPRVATLLPPAVLSPLPPLPSLTQLSFHSLLENFSLSFISKVETNLGIVTLKGVEVWPWGLVPELIVDLLVKYQDSPVHIIHPDEVGPPQVILYEADDTTGSFIPPVVMPRPLTPVDLSHSGG